MKAQQVEKIGYAATALVAAIVVVPIVLVIVSIFINGIEAISWEFLTEAPRNGMTEGGIWPAILGTLLLTIGTAIAALPFGIGAAIYLAEYAPDNWLTRAINIAIINLAGVPSIVHALFGVGAFVLFFRFGTSILAASLTLAIMTLPVVIVSTRESLQAVPQAFREACRNMGASRWQTIRHHVLPVAMPGILTGTILALSRAVGETAPLIMIGALTFIAFDPVTPMDPFTVLPIQIFNWTADPRADFHALAAGGIVVLLVILLLMNATAILLRNRYRKSL